MLSRVDYVILPPPLKFYNTVRTTLLVAYYYGHPYMVDEWMGFLPWWFLVRFSDGPSYEPQIPVTGTAIRHTDRRTGTQGG